MHNVKAAPVDITPQPGNAADIAMCATGRSGLGHLRRVSNIAAAVSRLLPSRDIRLISNAPVAGLHRNECANFSKTVLAERVEMAQTPDVAGARITVVDTAVLPGLHRVRGRLCLILRETISSKLDEFRLDDGRKWDMVVVPNPKEHWLPDAAAIGADRVEAVGWIYRRVKSEACRENRLPLSSAKRILIASGGGGNVETSRYIAGQCQKIITELRKKYQHPLHIVQTAGPRMPLDCLVGSCDEIVDPGPRLNELFDEFDLIISTAGYNSVLELAQTNKPVILMPIPRSFDDQLDRAEKWAARLGHSHSRDEVSATVTWATEVLAGNHLRRPCDLGPSGASWAASLMLELLR